MTAAASASLAGALFLRKSGAGGATLAGIGRKRRRLQMKLWKNWLAALALVVIGILATAVEGDATFLVVTLVFSTALIRARVPWFA